MPYHMRYDFKRRLNHCMPVAGEAKLGDVLYDLIAAVNALRADNVALRAALTTAAVSGLTVPATTAAAVLTPEQRNGGN